MSIVSDPAETRFFIRTLQQRGVAVPCFCTENPWTTEAVLRAADIAEPEGLSGLPLQDHEKFAERRVLVQYPFFQSSALDRRPQRLESVRSVAGEPTTPFLFGVEQVREVLMDRTRSHLDLETQVNRTAVREYDPQQVAQPFLIRAVGSNFSPESPITRHLGDLLFVWGNRFALDQERLAAARLRSRVLITTSNQSWSYPWRGGWLPPQIFASASYLPGPQPLTVLLQGRFQPTQLEEGKAHKLRAIAANVNAQSLQVWQEMLAFASEGDIYNADQVNERASAWASRIHSLCM